MSPLASIAGGESMLLRLLPELGRHGFAPLVTVPGRGPLRDACHTAGLSTTMLPLGPPEKRSVASYLGAALAPLQVARCDLTLLNGLPTQRVLPALRLLRRPAVVHMDNPLAEAPRAWGRPAFWRVVGAVLADSAHSAAECVAAGAPAERVRVVLPPAWAAGRTPATRAGAPPPASEAHVGFVGTLEPRKGVLELIEAAERFLAGRPGARLTVVGGPAAGHGDYVKRVEAAARLSPVSGQIELAGPLAGAAADMARFDLLAVPSLAEPFGTVAAEAAAAGVPVVASATGGLTEVVLDGQTGVLVAPGDPRALGEAIDALLGDPGRREALGRRAREQSLRFAPEAYAEAVAGLLRGVLARGVVG